MTERIIIAGAGGQGIMLLGKILATSAMEEDKFVTWLPSYGAEVRAGFLPVFLILRAHVLYWLWWSRRRRSSDYRRSRACCHF